MQGCTTYDTEFEAILPPLTLLSRKSQAFYARSKRNLTPHS